MKRFESKKDSWVIYILAGTLVLVVGLVYVIPSEKEIPLFVHIILAASFGLVYWMYVNTYTSIENSLKVHAHRNLHCKEMSQSLQVLPFETLCSSAIQL